MQIRILKMRPIIPIVLVIMATFFGPSLVAGESIVNTDKDIYHSGETIKVHFSNATGDNGDWICIVPAGSPDTEAGDYQYMPKGLSQGVLTFDAPLPGKYEARAYFNYRRNGYLVSARYGFSVESVITAPAKPVTGAEKIKPVESASVKALPTNAARISIAVFHFTSVNMEASHYGVKVTSTLINAPKMQSAFDILDRKDLETFLFANDLQQTDQIENVVNIGTKLGLNFVIAGSVETRGALIITDCKVISIDQKKVIFKNKSVSTGEMSLVRDVMKMSDDMIEAIRRSTS